MQKIAAAIISYLGNEEVREKRWEMQIKQLEWLKEIPIFEYVSIIAMEWTSQEIDLVTSMDERFHVIIKEKQPQGDARNILLGDFYDSDFDWCLFLDNDAILYNNHMSGTDFFQELCERKPDQLVGVDVILPIDPRQEPFTAEYLRNKEKVDNNLILKLFPGMKTSFFILKNLRKYKNKKEFFDIDFTILEDYEFACHLAYHGYSIYKSKNFVLKEYGTLISTLPYEENGGRKLLNDKWLLRIFDKWKDFSMGMKDGKVKGAKFMRFWYTVNEKQKNIIIPKKDKSGLNKFF